jgi:hypothetical protein
MCTNIILKNIVCNLCLWNIEIIFHSVVCNILYEIMKNASIMYAKYFIFLNIVQNVKAKSFSLHAWYDSSRYHSIWTISFCYKFFLYTYRLKPYESMLQHSKVPASHSNNLIGDKGFVHTYSKWQGHWYVKTKDMKIILK